MLLLEFKDRAFDAINELEHEMFTLPPKGPSNRSDITTLCEARYEGLQTTLNVGIRAKTKLCS